MIEVRNRISGCRSIISKSTTTTISETSDTSAIDHLKICYSQNNSLECERSGYPCVFIPEGAGQKSVDRKEIYRCLGE